MSIEKPLILLILPALLLIFWLFSKNKKEEALLYSPAVYLGKKLQKKFRLRGYAEDFPKLVFMVIMIVLLAHPYYGKIIHFEEKEVYNISLVLDVSGSMSLILPNLAVVSKTFVEIRPQDRFSIVLFSDSAKATPFSIKPDYLNGFEKKIKNLDRYKELSLGGGTEPGIGLLGALENILRDTETQPEDEISFLKSQIINQDKISFNGKKLKGQIVIMITDAEFYGSEKVQPTRVLEIMKDLDIKVYMIILTPNKPKGIIGAIAATGGKSWWIDSKLNSESIRSFFDKNFSEINVLEKAKEKTGSIIELNYLFDWFGTAAIFALLFFIFQSVPFKKR